MKAEVAIAGGGPAGAANAMFLLREGIKPLIIERETFPRYHIGESLIGQGGKVLRDLGLEAEMYKSQYPPISSARRRAGEISSFASCTTSTENSSVASRTASWSKMCT
jgi:2-polyprenyl-6-methoxyphenol hydroxylase-like FAD-dependent oxidoreductase